MLLPDALDEERVEVLRFERDRFNLFRRELLRLEALCRERHGVVPFGLYFQLETRCSVPTICLAGGGILLGVGCTG